MLMFIRAQKNAKCAFEQNKTSQKKIIANIHKKARKKKVKKYREKEHFLRSYRK